MNINNIFNRTQLLVGDTTMDVILSQRVIIIGIGGVGSWCAESLVRSGISNVTLVDADKVSESNINRQAMATCKTIGEAKVVAMSNRIKEINPNASVTAIEEIYSKETATQFNLDNYDYVIDAIDNLSDKALLIINACKSQAKFFASMGAALKTDATRLSVAEFWKIKGCPLAAALRRKFKQNKTYPSHKFKCVYSDELFNNRGKSIAVEDEDSMRFNKVSVNGTLSHITAIFGFTLAGLVIQDIIRCTDEL